MSEAAAGAPPPRAWSARRAEGRQNLYYRLMLTSRFAEPASVPEDGPQFRAAPPPDYIYGRYYRGVREPDDHFFPVVYRPGDEESGGTYLVN